MSSSPPYKAAGCLARGALLFKQSLQCLNQSQEVRFEDKCKGPSEARKAVSQCLCWLCQLLTWGAGKGGRDEVTGPWPRRSHTPLGSHRKPAFKQTWRLCGSRPYFPMGSHSPSGELSGVDMATKALLAPTSFSCKSQKILPGGSSIQGSEWLSKNYHLPAQFSLFPKRRRQEAAAGMKPASACRQSKENMRMLSSGCPGKGGRREPLFTLASIPDTSHGQVYSETDLLTG